MSPMRKFDDQRVLRSYCYELKLWVMGGELLLWLKQIWFHINCVYWKFQFHSMRRIRVDMLNLRPYFQYRCCGDKSIFRERSPRRAMCSANLEVYKFFNALSAESILFIDCELSGEFDGVLEESCYIQQWCPFSWLIAYCVFLLKLYWCIHCLTWPY